MYEINNLAKQYVNQSEIHNNTKARITHPQSMHLYTVPQDY